MIDMTKILTGDKFLMSKDKIVMRINFKKGICAIINDSLLPFQMKGRIKEHDGKNDIESAIANSNLLMGFFSSRAVNLNRDNAKAIYNALRWDQNQNTQNLSEIAILCKGLTIRDNFWLKDENDKLSWKDVNLREIPIHESLSEIALLGSAMSLEQLPLSPETSTFGTYAKCWLREENGLYLHKLGRHGNTESKIEIMVSNLLDNMNVPHITYETGTAHGKATCKCKCMTHDSLSMMHGMEFSKYCVSKKLDEFSESIRIDPEMVFKMAIVDYLISNPDRHEYNWGLFYDPDTMQILGHHPLYDHNLAFGMITMANKDIQYRYDGNRTMRGAAKTGMENIDFHFYREFTRSDFMNEAQYASFSERAMELGISIKQKQPESENWHNRYTHPK